MGMKRRILASNLQGETAGKMNRFFRDKLPFPVLGLGPSKFRQSSGVADSAATWPINIRSK